MGAVLEQAAYVVLTVGALYLDFNSDERPSWNAIAPAFVQA